MTQQIIVESLTSFILGHGTALDADTYWRPFGLIDHWSLSPSGFPPICDGRSLFLRGYWSFYSMKASFFTKSGAGRLITA
jgi:hypothetical protein